MMDVIIGGIVLIVIGAAIAYIVKEKKRGAKCIGCGASGGCSGCGGGCRSQQKP